MLDPTLLDKSFTKRTEPERLVSSIPVFLQITNIQISPKSCFKCSLIKVLYYVINNLHCSPLCHDSYRHLVTESLGEF